MINGKQTNSLDFEVKSRAYNILFKKIQDKKCKTFYFYFLNLFYALNKPKINFNNILKRL